MAGVKGKSGRKANERPFRDALTQILGELDPVTGRKRFFSVAQKLVEQAEEGDTQAIREVMDRMDGKPKQATEISGPDGDAIPLSIDVNFRSTKG